MKLLLYCTKAKPDFLKDCKYKFIPVKVNGKIVAECDYEVEEIINYHNSITYYTQSLNQQELLNKSRLDICKLDDYLKGKNGYAIHIKNLNIFDEPKELKDLEPKREIHQCIHGNLIIDEELEIPIKAPQNMMYVYDSLGNKYVLISIRPEWLVKILKGQKTIEVRKKVLKEMIK